MAIEKIEFIADRVGIHPATRQESGYKLDIAAYGVRVTLTDELTELLNANKGAGNLVYRFDVYNAGEEYERTATSPLGSEPIEYTLTKQDARVSGMVRIIPVVTSVCNKVAIYEKRLGIITLNVKATPEEETDYAKDKASLSSLERSAKQAAADAQAALAECIEAREGTEAARAALEGDDTTYIFDGGGADDEYDTDIVIDDFVSENSINPVTSRAIAAKLRLLEADLRAAIVTEVAAAVQEATADLASEVKESIFEVGDIIATVSNTNPATRFGGAWERIGKGKTLVGVDEDDEDFNLPEKTGGSKELQSHSHTGTTGEGIYGDVLRVVSAAGSNYEGNHTPGYASSQFSDLQNARSAHIHEFTTNNTGDGDSGNLQPFITTYFWVKRA